MKINIYKITILLFISTTVFSQEKKVSKETVEEACGCIAKINLKIGSQAKNDSIESCITQSIISTQAKKILAEMQKSADTLKAKEVKKEVKDKQFVIDTSEGYQEIQRQLLDECDALKRLMMSENSVLENSVSDNTKARNFYQQGEKYFNEEKYDLALVEYSKATKADPKFAFAWDNMGVCYRKLNRFKEAIECYKKSVALDPKGVMPLQNMAVAYDYLKDYKSAADVYLKMTEYYPEDPEGFYGAGRMLFLNKEYEKGLDYLFQSYIIYRNTNSPYIQDAEQSIRIFYAELKEMNKLEIIKKVAEKYNINLQN